MAIQNAGLGQDTVQLDRRLHGMAKPASQDLICRGMGVRLSEGHEGDRLLHTHGWRSSLYVKHSGLNDEGLRAECRLEAVVSRRCAEAPGA
jgi:hypothetical protein